MSTSTLSTSSSIRALGATRFNATRSIVIRGVRTRGAMKTEGNGDRRMRTIESMPFQTYQLALDVINKDRREKLERITAEREKIKKLIQHTWHTHTSRRIISMKQEIEKWQLYADANSPRVKYNFDCGIIGMNKPIYLHLLKKKWEMRNRPILMQRLETMHVIPDVLPTIDPVVDVQVRFRGKKVQPGLMLDSSMTENHPTFKVIPFQQEDMLCTVAVVDPDVPDPKKDGFRYRCHWIVSNIPISPRQTSAIGRNAQASNTILPYLPPHVQKGSAYHRYAMILFKQPHKIDAAALEGKIDRDNFIMRSFQSKHKLETVGAFMWRGQWDDHTKDIMQRHNLPGWDTMYRRIKDVPS